MPKWSQIYRKSKGLFHSKHWVGAILTLWPMGVGVALASYAQQVPEEAFYFAYLLLTAAFIWSLGAYLTSAFLSTKREQKIRVRKNRKRTTEVVKTTRRFYSWMALGGIPILALFIGCTWLTRSIQIHRQLSELGGILIPADDPDPPNPCTVPVPASSVAVYYGDSVSYTRHDHGAIVTVAYKALMFGDPIKKEILGFDRNPDGTVSLHADIRSNDGRVIAEINKNRFYVNENNILKSLFVRPDRSTIRLTDEFNNDIEIRYMNRHAMKISGRFAIGPHRAFEIEKNGRTIMPDGNEMDHSCSEDTYSVLEFTFK